MTLFQTLGMELFSSQLLKGHYIKKQCVCLQRDQRPTGNNQLFGSSLAKESFPYILIMCRMTLRIRMSQQIRN